VGGPGEKEQPCELGSAKCKEQREGLKTSERGGSVRHIVMRSVRWTHAKWRLEWRLQLGYLTGVVTAVTRRLESNAD
jgi:hypothetical protein